VDIRTLIQKISLNLPSNKKNGFASGAVTSDQLRWSHDNAGFRVLPDLQTLDHAVLGQLKELRLAQRCKRRRILDSDAFCRIRRETEVV
jgi:hypothetical protein